MIKILDSPVGICNVCSNCQVKNTGGNNIDEPAFIAPVCIVKGFIIEPLPIDEQVKECTHFKTKNIMDKDINLTEQRELFEEISNIKYDTTSCWFYAK